MSSDSTGIERWLGEEFASRLSSVIEAMAGAPVSVAYRSPAPAPPASGLLWRQPLAPLSGAILVVVAEASQIAIGSHILSAAGIEDSEPSELKSTCKEVLGQALSGLAQSLTARLNREVTCASGNEAAEIADGGNWSALNATLGETPVTIAFELEPALLDSLVAVPRESAAPDRAVASIAAATADASRTFDLLLDVELPVSVSFGHAQVLLKDVLKLTTGSIVELDRAIVEPVDIVVNNCVIARGEVVVVEGNFGVRIQKVVSREERVRTLK